MQTVPSSLSCTADALHMAPAGTLAVVGSRPTRSIAVPVNGV